MPRECLSDGFKGLANDLGKQCGLGAALLPARFGVPSSF